MKAERNVEWQPWFSPKDFLKFPGWQRRHLWKLTQGMLNPFAQPYEVSYNTEGDFDLRCMSWLSEPDRCGLLHHLVNPSYRKHINSTL